MKKILKGIISSILLSQIIFLMIPFNINADTTTNTAPFIGINVQVTGFYEDQSSITFPALNISEISANQSEARMTGQLNCTSPSTPTSSAPCDVFSFADRNGNSSQYYGAVIDLNLQGYLLKFNGNATINGINYFIVDYEFILDDTYKGSVVINGQTLYVNGSSFHHSVRQSDLTEIDFSITSYNLVRIYDNVMWSFPIESYTFVNQFIKSGFQITDFYNDSNYQYPLFFIPADTNIFSNWSNTSDEFKQVLILGVSKNIYNEQSFYNYFGVNNFRLISITRLSRKDYPNTYNNQFSIFKLVYNTSDPNTANARFTFKEDTYCIPIYHEYLSSNNISTDFALINGLSNTMLDNIDFLANGNTQSNQSASDLQQSTDSMQDQMDDMVDIESGYNQQFNNSLNNIDFTNPIQNNAGILPAANFVITVFNGLVNNPLSILIIIICILTIGKKVIGK